MTNTSIYMSTYSLSQDRSCNTSRAVFALKTKHKLCLTGTPLQNRIGEFFSLLRFLEVDPFSYYFCRKCPCKSLHWKFSDMRHCDQCKHRPMDHCCWFNSELLKPIQLNGNEGEGKLAFEKLHKLLSHIMLRRTKMERADDLGLPPRIVRIRRDYFNEEELDLYDSIYGESKRKFNTYVAQGVVLARLPPLLDLNIETNFVLEQLRKHLYIDHTNAPIGRSPRSCSPKTGARRAKHPCMLHLRRRSRGRNPVQVPPQILPSLCHKVYRWVHWQQCPGLSALPYITLN